MIKGLLLDIGGSGLKYAVVFRDAFLTNFDVIESERLPIPSWNNLAKTLYENGLLSDVSDIAISCAGDIREGGTVVNCRTTGWKNKDLKSELKNYQPNSDIVVINDAEAHLFAHTGFDSGPTLCVTLGTSLNIAVADHHHWRPVKNVRISFVHKKKGVQFC